jgi:hypothetical protein
VLLEIANKEVAGNLTDADREYVQQLPAGQKEQYKLIREGVEDATLIRRKKQKDVQQQRVGDNAQLQKEAQDRDKQAKLKEKGTQAGAGDSLQQAAGELSPENKAALQAAGVDVDALAAGTKTIETPASEPSPVDDAVARARAKALSEKPPAGKKVEPKAEPAQPPAAPVVDTGAAPPKPAAKDWVTTVPETPFAWVEPVAGKERNAFSIDYGFKSTASNKEESNTKGIFRKPDMTIAVATLKKTGAKKVERVEQGPGKTAKSYTDLAAEGWKLIGYSRGNTESKFYQEYTPEEWNALQPQLAAKAEIGKSAVSAPAEVTKAEAVTAGISATGGITSDAGKGALSKSEAT